MTPRDAILVVKVKVLKCWTTEEYFLSSMFQAWDLLLMSACLFCGLSACLLFCLFFMLLRATNTESRHWEWTQRWDRWWKVLHKALTFRINVAMQAYLFASRSWRSVSSNRVWIWEWEQSSSCGSCRWVAWTAISVIDIPCKLTNELHSSLTRFVSLAYALAFSDWESKLISVRHVALCDSFQLE